MADTADAEAAIQHLADTGKLDLQAKGPVKVFIVHRGIVLFDLDDTGRVLEVSHDKDS